MQRLRQTLESHGRAGGEILLVAIRPTDVLCPAADCLGYANDKVLFFDEHHLSLSGARAVASLFADVIAGGS